MSNNITQIAGNISGKIIIDVNKITPENADGKEVAQPIKTRFRILYILFAVSIVLSFVAVARTFTKDLSFDWSGVIVSALSLLVAVLIGWQIFNLIKIDHLKTSLENAEVKIEQLKTDAQKELYKFSAQSILLHAKDYIEQADVKSGKCKSLKFAYCLAANALQYHLLARESDLIDACISVFNVCLSAASTLDKWGDVFSSDTEKEIQQCYTTILSMAYLMNETQLDTLNAIHRSRVDKRLHATLRS